MPAGSHGSAAPDPGELLDEAADFVEVVRRLWDSWEDDAVIRDVATGRYVDREKLHYIDFSGRSFSVKGPSITPRPPQGQLVVAALAHAEWGPEFASATSDVVFITLKDEHAQDHHRSGPRSRRPAPEGDRRPSTPTARRCGNV